MKKPSVVLWDWNGTLLDDLDFSVHCLNLLLSEHDYQKQYTLPEYRAIFGFPIEEYYLRAGFDFNTHAFSALAARYIELFIPGSKECHTMAYARETLQRIQQAGISQVMLSASPTYILEKQVAERGLTDFFDALLGLDDIYAKSKTARGIDWINQAKIDPATAVMIGDTDHDVQVATAMGVRCILYAGGHQPRETLVATGCTVIDHLCELSTLLDI